LEAIGFIARATPEERYTKVHPGVWRIHFCAGSGPTLAGTSVREAQQHKPAGTPEGGNLVEESALATAEGRVVATFHRLRFGDEHYRPLRKELAFARDVTDARGGNRTPGHPSHSGPRHLRMVDRISW